MPKKTAKPDKLAELATHRERLRVVRRGIGKLKSDLASAEATEAKLTAEIAKLEKAVGEADAPKEK